MMRPAAVLAFGLLRPRGDRPRISAEVACCIVAPPPARRSTRIASACESKTAGSSARAEIDPSSTARSTRSARLLRPRGDRPSAGSPPEVRRMAPPPARRSTPARRPAAPVLYGSSARAEIDPRKTQARKGVRRLLRPRGDRPISSCTSSTGNAAPPPARRSTRMAQQLVAEGHGSSARAEIDPSSHHTLEARCWLLRPRGDRPSNHGSLFRHE